MPNISLAPITPAHHCEEGGLPCSLLHGTMLGDREWAPPARMEVAIWSNTFIIGGSPPIAWIFLCWSIAPRIEVLRMALQASGAYPMMNGKSFTGESQAEVGLPYS